MRVFVRGIYTFSYRYILEIRVFPKSKYSVLCTEFAMGPKFHFLNEKFIFPNSSSLINT